MLEKTEKIHLGELNKIMKKLDLKYTSRGMGLVKEQFPSPGAKLKTDAKVKFLFQMEEVL